MVKNKSNKTCTSSAPCVNERAGKVHASAERSECTGRVHASKASRTVRICCTLLSLFCLCFVAFGDLTAHAFVVDIGDTKLGTMLQGSARVTFDADSPDEVSGLVSVQYPFGGLLPYPPTTGGAYFGEEQKDYLLSDYRSSDWYIYSVTTLGRYKQSIALPDGNRNFDMCRYVIKPTEYGDGGVNSAIMKEAVLTYDPYLFESFNWNVFQQMLEIRIYEQVTWSLNINWSVFKADQNRVVSGASVAGGTEGTSNGLAIRCLSSLKNSNMSIINDGDKVMINSITIEIDPLDDKLDTLNFSVLGEQWSAGKPIYYHDPGYSSSVWTRYINDNIKRTNVTEVAPDGTAAWLANVLKGFFDVEIFPGFSFGGIFVVLISFVLVVVILKVFAGG